MWSETTSNGDLQEPMCDLARVRAAAFRLSICKRSGALTPTVCLDQNDLLFPRRWFSPDTPATPVAMCVSRIWQPHPNKLLPAGRKYVFLDVDQYLETVQLGWEIMEVD